MNIELTEDECYLIEREFDRVYSLTELQFRKAIEEFIFTKASGITDDNILNKMAHIGIDLAEASTRYKAISMKFEKVRSK